MSPVQRERRLADAGHALDDGDDRAVGGVLAGQAAVRLGQRVRPSREDGKVRWQLCGRHSR